MLNSKDYQDAIDVQNACNLSGVVHSFSRVISKVWDEAHANGQGTDYVNRHPIAVMYASKIASLTGSEIDGEFSKAYQACQDGAAKRAA